MYRRYACVVLLLLACATSFAQVDTVKITTTGPNIDAMYDNRVGTNFTAYQWVVAAAADSIYGVAVTASRAVATDANGLPTVTSTTATELGYLNGVTSPIQTQFSGKVGTSDVRILWSNGLIDSVGTSDTVLIGHVLVAATLDSIVYDAIRAVEVKAKVELVDSLGQTSGATLLDTTTVTNQRNKQSGASLDGTTLSAGKIVRITFPTVATKPKTFYWTVYGH